MTRPLPYRPARDLVPVLGDHTLVRATGTVPTPTCAVTAHARQVWLTISAATRGSLTLLEVAARTGITRGTARVAVNTLLRAGAARISRGLGAGVAERIRDQLTPTPYDPALCSAKFLVLGQHQERRTFVETLNPTSLVTVRERVRPHGPEQVDLAMARLPLPQAELCLLSVSVPWQLLWDEAAREAVAALVVTTPDAWDQEGAHVRFARSHRLPVQVVVDHRHGPGPDLDALTEQLDVAQEQVTLCAVHHRDAVFGAVRDVVHQSCRAPTPFSPVMPAEMP